MKRTGRDVSASLVVFLVALPLGLGIAMASGMPLRAGLVASIVGGLFVGAVGGSPLQVSGPAAGLTVVVWSIAERHGIQGTFAVVMGAGAIQAIAARAGLGRVFRAVSPAVVYGMLAGIGVLLCASQLHVMLGARPQGSGPDNLAALPGALGKLLWADANGSGRAAAALGALTIAAMSGWQKLAPQRLRQLPAALVGVLCAAIAAALSGARVAYVRLDSQLLTRWALPDFHVLLEAPALGAALSLATIASAETLLCAAAVDRMQTRVRTQYDRELLAQGLGNVLSGLLGGLPLTGVIVRSAANVEAGAQTRLSSMLHGAWMLLLVALAPGVLQHVPSASLAGMLVYTGCKLVSPQHVRELRDFGRGSVGIYLVTLGVVVARDLLSGVLLGLALSMLRLLWKLLRFELELQVSEARVDLALRGVLSFLALPRLSSALERLPQTSELHLHVDGLRFVDHAGLCALRDFEAQASARGVRVLLDWDHLDARREGKRPGVTTAP